MASIYAAPERIQAAVLPALPDTMPPSRLCATGKNANGEGIAHDLETLFLNCINVIRICT
jgi:hypothetical protein